MPLRRALLQAASHIPYLILPSSPLTPSNSADPLLLSRDLLVRHQRQSHADNRPVTASARPGGTGQSMAVNSSPGTATANHSGAEHSGDEGDEGDEHDERDATDSARGRDYAEYEQDATMVSHQQIPRHHNAFTVLQPPATDPGLAKASPVGQPPSAPVHMPTGANFPTGANEISENTNLSTGNPGSFQPMLMPDTEEQHPAMMFTDPMLTVDGSPDLELFWNDMHSFNHSLPNDFFDTDFTITDISQRLAFNRREEEQSTAQVVMAMGPLEPIAASMPMPSGANLQMQGTVTPVAQKQPV